MNNEGQVMQLAKARLREALAAKQKIIWDATSLLRDGRSAILGLGHDCHAFTTIGVFTVHPDVLIQRNRKRNHQVPTAIIERQLTNLEWPIADEAHRLVMVDST